MIAQIELTCLDCVPQRRATDRICSPNGGFEDVEVARHRHIDADPVCEVENEQFILRV